MTSSESHPTREQPKAEPAANRPALRRKQRLSIKVVPALSSLAKGFCSAGPPKHVSKRPYNTEVLNFLGNGPQAPDHLCFLYAGIHYVAVNFGWWSLRTRRMKEIAAGMRTLALVGLPLRTQLTRSESVGRRLAAICIFRLSRVQDYFKWLIERVKTESQRLSSTKRQSQFGIGKAPVLRERG